MRPCVKCTAAKHKTFLKQFFKTKEPSYTEQLKLADTKCAQHIFPREILCHCLFSSRPTAGRIIHDFCKMADSATSLSPSAAGSGQNFSADDEKKKCHKKCNRKLTKGEYCRRNIFKCDTLIIVTIISTEYDNQIFFYAQFVDLNRPKNIFVLNE